MNKKFILYFLLVVIGFVFVFNRHQIFFDKTLTPEEIKIREESFNQRMLEQMKLSEEESLSKLQEEKAYDDCIRSSIANGEYMNTYFQKCAEESRLRVKGRSRSY